MDNVLMIKECQNDEELKELANEAIDVYTKQAKKENSENYIGTNLDINPLNYHLNEPNFEFEDLYEGVSFWNGYIPLGTKMVYGRFYDEKYKTSSHKGCYYYLDDDDYIFEFFKYIKDLEIEDDYDIVIAVHSFIEKKFAKYFEPKERGEIHKLIYRSDGLFLRPIKEHSIKDFYYNGSAMCSEIAAVAENLLSSLGLEVMYFSDKEHAFNLYVSHDKDDPYMYILDFSNWVECYDVNYKLIGKTPFFGKIVDGNQELVDKMVNEGKRIELDDYYLYRINGRLFEIKNGRKRNYGTDFALQEENKLILNRKMIG